MRNVLNSCFLFFAALFFLAQNLGAQTSANQPAVNQAQQSVVGHTGAGNNPNVPNSATSSPPKSAPAPAPVAQAPAHVDAGSGSTGNASSHALLPTPASLPAPVTAVDRVRAQELVDGTTSVSKTDNVTTASANLMANDGGTYRASFAVSATLAADFQKYLNQDPCGMQFGAYTCDVSHCWPSGTGTQASQISDYLSRLDYMGQQFTGPAVCVRAKNDAEGIDACGAIHKKAINPINPQYWDPNKAAILKTVMVAAKGQEVTLSRTENPYNFYLCVGRLGEFENSKSEMCKQQALQSSDWPNAQTLNITWVPKNGGPDGDCMCTMSSGSTILCQAQLAIQDPCAPVGLGIDDRTGATRPSPTECKCPQADVQGRPHYVQSTNAAGCALAATPPSADATAAAAAAVPAAPSPELVSCIESLVHEAQACKDGADSAKRICSETGSGDSGIGGLSTAINNLNAGSGAQDTCFKASLLGSSANMAIGSNTQNCSDAATSCNSSCGADKFAAKRTQCEGKIVQSNPHDVSYFNEHANEINASESNYTEGTRICSDDVPKAKSTLDSLLSSVGNSLHDSLKCACQLSATGTSSCDSIPTVDTCASNPQAVGCGIYTGLASCNQNGPTYNAQLCACQMEPNLAGCVPGTVSGNLSSFASGAIKSAAIAAVGGALPMGGSGGALKGGNIDLSGLGNQADEAALGAVGSKTPGNVALSGNGVGGSGAGRSNGDTSATTAGAAGENGDSKGLSGLFGQVKNSLSSALGLKSKDNGDSGKGAKAAIDPNKFRPGRGLASGETIGKKNMDIWKMMNNCVQGETCRSNMNNYLLTP